jgi:subtilisin family serine protease
VLVMLDPAGGPRAQASAAHAFLARTRVRRAGAQVPQIGLVTVALPAGLDYAAYARMLHADPAVRSVQPEGTMSPRATANDPALTRPETAPGTPPGTPQQWQAQRQRFGRAWDFTTGAGALVGVIDTGVDGTHPELSGKVAAAVNQDSAGRSALTDEEGHGTHVASLACAATGNGVGIAGAGRDCRLIVEKSDLTDSSIAASIVDATDRGALAINMSFGDDGTRAPVQAIVGALDYALARQVVLVAAASDEAVEEQGQPPSLLQPTGTGPDPSAGRGLSVTASDFADANPGTGRGSQISMAAAGSFGDFSPSGSISGPPGLLGAAPAGRARRLDGDPTAVPPVVPCNCRTSSEGATFAYLRGTSMAAPQVAAIAALMRRLNPDASARDVIRMLKQTARRPTGAGWAKELGWGILDAGAAMEAIAALDRRAPVSRASAPRNTRARRFRVSWTASDPAPPGVRSSGVAFVELWRSIDGGPFRRIGAYARARSTVVRGASGRRYSFLTVAVDRAGNREARRRRGDVTVRVR